MTQRERRREERRRYVAKHRELGLCVHCTKPADAGHATCAYHREYARLRSASAAHKEYHRAWRKKRILKRLTQPNRTESESV